MRIITGKYKGRHFEIPRSFKARPTTDFAKENIFNVLNGYIDFEDAAASTSSQVRAVSRSNSCPEDAVRSSASSQTGTTTASYRNV